MPDPTFGLHSTLSSQTSFVNRIRENFTLLWSMPRVALAAPYAVNAAPIHLLDERHGRIGLTGQAGSTFLHGVIFAILIYAAFHPIDKANLNTLQNSFPLRKLQYTPPMQTITAEISFPGKAGAGGEHNPLPPTAGELAYASRIAFATPRLPDDKLQLLSLPATKLDANAP